MVVGNLSTTIIYLSTLTTNIMHKIILILVVFIVTITSCTNKATVRGIDVITNKVIPVSVDTTIYKSGDSIWVDINTNKPTYKSHYYSSHYHYRLYKIEF